MDFNWKTITLQFKWKVDQIKLIDSMRAFLCVCFNVNRYL